MTAFDTVVAGGTVVSPDGQQRLDLGIRDGRVAALMAPGTEVEAGETIDATGRHVLPGLVDPHAHIGLGGEEDWRTESEMAARGGITTVINYVLGGDSYHQLVAAERALADSLSHIDYGIHVCPCSRQHLDELGEYASELGVCSFKSFMSFRGEEGAYLGIEGIDDGYLFEYLERVAEQPAGVANVHAENIELVWKLRAELAGQPPETLSDFEATRPDIAEAEATARAAYFAGMTGTSLYVVHVSAAAALHEIELARTRGTEAPLYAETCTHYLTHTVDSPVGPLGKVNPPLRHEADREELWRGLADGRIQVVGSDHVPRHRELKEVGVAKSPAGIAGIGTTLTVLLSEGYHARGLSLEKIVELTAANPARIFGLEGRKGSLEVGADADLVLVDLDRRRTVDAGTWGGAAGYNLYEGWAMTGWPTLTMRRGETICAEGEIRGEPGSGAYLHRGAATAPNSPDEEAV